MRQQETYRGVLENEKLQEDETGKRRHAERRIGSKILAGVDFGGRHKEIVDSSLKKEMARGEKFLGKNAERRNMAYLGRLEKAIDKYGNDLEKRLWNKSIDKLIIQPEDIERDYWKRQEQILRDDGQGRELGNYEKELLTKDLQKHQRESLQSWANYLGDEQAPYPMWFKVYAWDGVSKMGVFDKNKKEFKNRDKHTVAPYPKLNPAVLAKVHGAISDFYGHEDKERYAENVERDEELEALVKSRNFNKLYSKFLLEQKAIPRTPERTEDVRGSWIEYLPGQEEDLANAAEGTPWCVADPGTGRNYLEYGRYGHDEDELEDDEPEEMQPENRAKFILFHLDDPETGNLAENACASIRLGVDGRVAEISGLDDGQALEAALVPIVEEKVKTLPGGEEFLEAFADKKRLIEIDRKMQAGEKLTKEDVEFIGGDIKTLDTYNDEDPRIEELIGYCFDNLEMFETTGANLTGIVKKAMAYEIYNHFDQLLEIGVDPTELAKKMDSYNVNKRFDQLLEAGADPVELAKMLDGGDFDERLDQLLEAGADPIGLTEEMDEYYIGIYLDQLLKAGADPIELAGRLHRSDIDEHFDQLLEAGANPIELAKKIDKYEIHLHFDQLLKAGADPAELIERMYSDDVDQHFDQLLELGVDPAELIRHMSADGVKQYFDRLLELGVSPTELMKKMDKRDVSRRFKQLLELGVDPAEMIKNMHSEDINLHFNQLLELGVDPMELVEKINNAYSLSGHFDQLIEAGANPTELVKKMNDDGIIWHFSQLLELGVDPAEMMKKMSRSSVSKHFESLIKAGMEPIEIARRLGSMYIDDHFDDFIKLGVGRNDLEKIRAQT